jgi:hypothetical protein
MNEEEVKVSEEEEKERYRPIGWIGDNIEVYLEPLSFNICVDDLLDTNSAVDFLELLQGADYDVKFYNGGFNVAGDSIALTFENVECRLGFEIFTITRKDFEWDDLEWLEKKLEDPEWLEECDEEEEEEDYFAIYSCPTAQLNYVLHIRDVKDVKDAFDNMLEYLQGSRGFKDKHDELKIIRQLKAVFADKKIRLVMPKLAKTFTKILDEIEEKLQKDLE